MTPAEAVPGRSARVAWRPRRHRRRARPRRHRRHRRPRRSPRSAWPPSRAYGFRPAAARRLRGRRASTGSRVLDELVDADAIVVVAGMEGALASVVGGLTPAPLVAVPTSVGYGAGLEGRDRAARDARLVRAGVAVVGIDNGYGAACAVARMLREPRRRAASRIAWFHCFAGIAGDMALGSLLDAGRRPRRGAGLLEAPADRRMGPRHRTGDAGRLGRHAGARRGARRRRDRTVPAILGSSRRRACPTRVAERAVAAFSALAEVEGRIHRRPPAEVHFHELGGTTRSSTSSARPPRSSSSASTRSTASPVATGRGWSGAATACSRTRRQPSSSCCAAPRSTAVTSTSSSRPRPAPRCSRRWATLRPDARR